MIGRGETANECSGNFDDLMLKEWGRECDTYQLEDEKMFIKTMHSLY